MRLRPSPDWEPMFASLIALKRDWPARGWSWDTRLVCITSSFAGEFVEPARAALKLALPTEYNAKTLPTAHPYVLDAVEQAGGLRSNQFACTSGPLPTAHLMTFALWWPWNDQETVSVRVGFAKLEANDEPYSRFREIFGVSVY
jgi:hypothetical protein